MQRQPVQFVVNSLVGIGIAAVFAARTGKAEDVFLPGIIYNAAYAVVLTLSILVRWPVVGLMLGSVTGDLTAWRKDPAVVRLCSKLTLVLAVPCIVRVAGAVAALPRRRGGLARRHEDRAGLAAAGGRPGGDGLAAGPRPDPDQRDRPPVRLRRASQSPTPPDGSAGVRGEQLLELRAHVGAGDEQQLVAGLERVVRATARSAGPRG